MCLEEVDATHRERQRFNGHRGRHAGVGGRGVDLAQARAERNDLDRHAGFEQRHHLTQVRATVAIQTCHHEKGRTQPKLTGAELPPVEVGEDGIMGFGFVLGADLQLGNAQGAEDSSDPIEVFLGELPDFALLGLNRSGGRIESAVRALLLHFAERWDELLHTFEPFRRHRS